MTAFWGRQRQSVQSCIARWVPPAVIQPITAAPGRRNFLKGETMSLTFGAKPFSRVQGRNRLGLGYVQALSCNHRRTNLPL